jgi:hypothetical protein
MFLTMATLLLSTAAVAHEDHVGPNGGYTKHLGSVSVEVVAKGTQVILHVRDETTEQPLSVNGASAKVVLLAGGKTETLQLRPAGPVLAATAKQPVGANAKVAVTLTMPGRDKIPAATFDLSKLLSLPSAGGH